MLINAERQPADQDAGDLCDPTQYAPRDRRPYWNEDIASFSAAVWLPTGTADRGAAINRPHGWSSKTAVHSWFSTNRIAAPNPDLPRLYSPAAVQSTTICSNQGATGQQSRRIQVYPDSAQKVTITTWLTASRWTYNLTAEILQSGIPAVWKHSCPASTIFAGWRQSVLPVHLLGLAPLLGSVGPVAGDVKLQDDGVVHDPVNRRGGGHGVGKDALPLREDQV